MKAMNEKMSDDIAPHDVLGEGIKEDLWTPATLTPSVADMTVLTGVGQYSGGCFVCQRLQLRTPHG